MKVSVIVEDKTVVVDGVAHKIPEDRWPSTPSDVWAYQWNGSVGDTETNTTNVAFSDISTIQAYIDIHTTINNEVVASETAGTKITD
jgi:hypothetical protein